MFGLGMPELILILLICLLVFGAARLPEIAKNLGKGIKEFKKEMSGEEKASKNEPEEDKKNHNAL